MFKRDRYWGLPPEEMLRAMLRDGVDFTGLATEEFLASHFVSVELKRPAHERFDMTGELVTYPSDTVEVTAETHRGEALDFKVSIEMIGGRRAGKSMTLDKLKKEIKHRGGGTKPKIKAPDSFAEMGAAAATAAKSLEDFGKAAKKVDDSWFDETKALEAMKEKIAGKSATGWVLDELEVEKSGGKVIYNKKQVGEALEPYIDLLDSALNSVDGFTLTEPRSITRKGSDDGFSKIPLIGGEKLEGIKAYMGKRDGIIFVFESEGVEGTLEINGADAMESLEGFEEFINDAIGFDFMEKVGDLVMTAEALKKSKRVKQAEESYGPEFGTW